MVDSGARERFVVDVPIAQRLRLAESSLAFHNRIGNDESWELSSYIEDVTAQWRPLSDDASAEGFGHVKATVQALDVSRRVVTWLLAVRRVSRDLGTHVQLRTAAVADAASDPLTRVVLDNVLNEVSNQLADSEMNPPGLVRVVGVAASTWVPGPYEFFLSYKHMLHRDTVIALARELRNRGSSCFLDLDDLPVEVVETGLYRGLRSALDASRCCVFFETVAQSVEGDQLVGGQTAASVHAFELRHARNVVFIRMSPQEVYTRSGSTAGWSTIEHLAEILLDELGLDDSSTRFKEPPLEHVLEIAERTVEEVVGTTVTVAPLAALAIAAPAQIDLGTLHSLPALGDAVLRTLLTYDIETSLTLEEAGVPPTAYAAATAAWPEGRWARSSPTATAAWPTDVVARVTDRISRTGCFDEAALALGLLGAARHPASFPGRALRTALAGLPSAVGEPTEQQVIDVIEKASDALDRAAAGPRHAWVLRESDADNALVATSWAGPYRLDSHPGSAFYVLAGLGPGLIPLDLVDQHTDSIRAVMTGGTTDAGYPMTWPPELAVALTPAAGRPLPVVDVSPDGDGAVLLAVAGDGAVDVLPGVLPPGFDRPVHQGWVNGVDGGGDGAATLLPDRLALWDLIARSAEHVEIRALDPAEMPRALGSVAPTSTATSSGSLWPARRSAPTG